MERTRIRSEAPAPTPDARLLQRLHAVGYQAKGLHFTNIRISHEHAEDGADAAHMALEVVPDIVLVELIGPPQDLAATMNAYVRGEIKAMPEEVPAIEFLHAIRELVIVDDLPNALRHVPEPLADALKAKEQLHIAAPYGMLHGGLSKAFREEGATVGAYVHDDARLSPLQALGFKCDYGEGALDDAKRALLGRRIESFIEGLLARGVFTAADGARLPALSRKETAQPS